MASSGLNALRPITQIWLPYKFTCISGHELPPAIFAILGSLAMVGHPGAKKAKFAVSRRAQRGAVVRRISDCKTTAVLVRATEMLINLATTW